MTTDHPAIPTTPMALSPATHRLDGPRDLAALHRDVWALLRANPLLFVALPLLVWLPFDLLAEAVSSTVNEDDFVGQLRSYYRVTQIGELMAGTFVPAVVMAALDELRRGHRLSLREALAKGARLWGVVFGTAFLCGLLVGLGTLLFVIPGLVLATRYAVFLPVVAFEGLSGMAALNRSREIVQQAGAWRVFRYGAVAYLVYLVLATMPSFAGGLALGLLDVEESLVLAAVLAGVVNLLPVGLVLGSTLLYLDTTATAAPYPVGLELTDADGRRVTPPRSRGAVGLAVATVSAAVCVPLMVLAVWAALDPAAFEEEPAAFEEWMDDDVLGDDLGEAALP